MIFNVLLKAIRLQAIIAPFRARQTLKWGTIWDAATL